MERTSNRLQVALKYEYKAKISSNTGDYILFYTQIFNIIWYIYIYIYNNNNNNNNNIESNNNNNNNNQIKLPPPANITIPPDVTPPRIQSSRSNKNPLKVDDNSNTSSLPDENPAQHPNAKSKISTTSSSNRISDTMKPTLSTSTDSLVHISSDDYNRLSDNERNNLLLKALLTLQNK